jgi:hydroxyacylglutathione hydrolase
MQVSENIHSLRINFKIPIRPDFFVERFVNIFLIFCNDKIVLIDSGVNGSTTFISNYLQQLGHKSEEIKLLILTHSHPDHIGNALNLQKMIGCKILAHKNEQSWIENIEQQFKERPVPGFYSLVAGPVKIDEFVDDGSIIQLDDKSQLKIYFTPGHSAGSISLFHTTDKVLICGDAVPVPGTQPIFDCYSQSMDSIDKLKSIQDVSVLLSSWDEPKKGNGILQAFDDGLIYLDKIVEIVNKNRNSFSEVNQMRWIESITAELGLDKSALNPLVSRSLLSCLSN